MGSYREPDRITDKRWDLGSRTCCKSGDTRKVPPGPSLAHLRGINGSGPQVVLVAYERAFTHALQGEGEALWEAL